MDSTALRAMQAPIKDRYVVYQTIKNGPKTSVSINRL
jgi:hypothetical protein